MPLFNLPVYDSSVGNSYTVYWGDGTSSLVNASSSILYHDYPSTGTYNLSVLPNSPTKFNNVNFYASNSNALKLKKIKKWGSFIPSSFDFSYYYSSKLINIEDSLLNLSNTSTMNFTWMGCSALTSFPLLDTSTITSFKGTWCDCIKLTSFPLINTSNAKFLASTQNDFDGPTGRIPYGAWQNCSSLTSFPLIDTSNVNLFDKAWWNCNKLKSFPLIKTLSGTTFHGTWAYCTSLTSFPLIDTSNAIYLGRSITNEQSGAWQGCSSLSSFPEINTSKVAFFSNAWQGCSSLTSFPSIDTSNAGTETSRDFYGVWNGCKSLTTFPWINTSAVMAFGTGNQGTIGTWTDCWSLTSFPLIDTSKASTFFETWKNCYNLKTFPEINLIGLSGNLASINNGVLPSTWQNCLTLTYFPKLNTSNCLSFYYTWRGCSSLTAFPLIDTSKSTSFSNTWAYCTSLSFSDFPTLDMGKMLDGTNCFLGVKLTTTSYSSILTSLCSTNFNNGVIFHGGNSKYSNSALSARNVLASSGALPNADSSPYFIKLLDGRFFFCGSGSGYNGFSQTTYQTYLGTLINLDSINWQMSNDLPISIRSSHNAYSYSQITSIDQLPDGRIIMYDGSTTIIGTLSTANSIKWNYDTSFDYITGFNVFPSNGAPASTIMKDISCIYINGGMDATGTKFRSHAIGKINTSNTVTWLTGYDPTADNLSIHGTFSHFLAASSNKIVMAFSTYGTNKLLFGTVNPNTGTTSFSTISTMSFDFYSGGGYSPPYLFLDSGYLIIPNHAIGNIDFNLNTISWKPLKYNNNYMPRNVQPKSIILDSSYTSLKTINYGYLRMEDSTTSYLISNAVILTDINKTTGIRTLSRFGGAGWTIVDGGYEQNV